MAIANSYPVGTVKTEDLILGTSIPLAGTNDKPVTKNFSVASVLALGSPPNILTAKFLITNAQLLTLGTVPITILPSVTNAYYQIIAASFTNTGSGSTNYIWGSSKGVLYNNSNTISSTHRVEVPTTSLPTGEIAVTTPYMGTPIAGTSRIGVAMSFSTDDGSDPSYLGGTPDGTITINLTYRLIQI